MKTLNRVKAEKIFNEFKRIGEEVKLLAGVVQNPDFVNEENAAENYTEFDKQYHSVVKQLNDLDVDIYLLHREIQK